jgi:hypothetical protein
VRIAADLGDAEVEQLDEVDGAPAHVADEEAVGGLDVAVDDVLGVRGRRAPDGLQEDVARA